MTLRCKAGPERAAWHEKAMVAAEKSDLASLLDLWSNTKETGRLVERLETTSDAELERLSHYYTEPAAERLDGSHPGIAARLYRAMCVRIINAA